MAVKAVATGARSLLGLERGSLLRQKGALTLFRVYSFVIALSASFLFFPGISRACDALRRLLCWGWHP